jgi:hypothetical protein
VGLAAFDLLFQTQESFMTGFIRGLFSRKAKNPGESDRPVRQQTNTNIEPVAGSYYLDPDDAKSYGNIEYMRTSKTVRRTFARKAGETSEKESIRRISAMEAVRLKENGLPEQQSPQAETFSQPVINKEPSFERRKVDTNLDMFRKMAKDIKK